MTANRGRLVLDFSWRKVRCREYLGLPDTKEGQAAARRIRKQIEGEIAAGTFDYAKWFPDGRKREVFAPPANSAEAVPTFAGLAREWLENKKAWFGPATYYDRKRIIEGKLSPFFGGDDQPPAASPRLVSAIRLEDIERLVNTVKEQKGIRGGKLSNRRANIILDVLRQILDRSVLRGWLPRNPGRGVPKLREDPAQIDPFSFKEVRTLLVKGLRDPWARRYFTVAFFTGLRPSEQIGTQWDAVDWVSEPPLIGVVAAVTRGGRGRTKTPGSKRYVAMLPIVQQAFRGQRGASQLRSSYVFPSQTGGPLDITNLRERVWKPALQRAKLRYRTMYQTRHTFATLALQSGEQIGWVSKQLGHTTDEMVIRHYAKFIPNLTRQDGSAFARVMRAQGLR